MKRREFIKNLGLQSTALGLTALGLNACQSEQTDTKTTTKKKQRIKWKMVTTWPRDFPGLGTSANKLAQLITILSDGELSVKVYGGNELVPPFETFDAVSRGTAEMGHSAAYYWKGKAEAAQFFAAVPFGLTATEMNGWLYHADGLELWQKLYSDFNLIPFPAGNTGVQMGGWFNKKINSITDIKGLKMRIPGLGGEAFKAVGGTPVNMPGSELFTALQTGAIDATEWVGPYNDLAFGLFRAAKYYYYPGWHEPNATIECIINKQKFEALPNHLKEIIKVACQAVNNDMLAEYTQRNHIALQTLIEEHKVTLLPFPDDVLAELKSASDQVVADLATLDNFTKEVFTSYVNYKKSVANYTDISEFSYLAKR